MYTVISWIDRVGVKTCVRGLWYEESEPDPSKDLVLYGQRLSRTLASHPRIRNLLRGLRAYYPWFLVGQMLCQIAFFHLVWIVYNWGNKEEIGKSCCDAITNGVISAMMLGFLRHKEKLRPLVENLKQLSKVDRLDDEEQKLMVEGTQATCEKLTKFILRVFAVTYFLPTFNLVFVEMMPNRKMFDKALYPYDEKASPAYEITILSQLTLTSSLIFAIATLVTFSYTIMINTNTQWKVLITKLRNIRLISMRKIKNRRVIEIGPITEQADSLENIIDQDPRFDYGRTGSRDLLDVDYEYDLPGCAPRSRDVVELAEGSLTSISEGIERSIEAELETLESEVPEYAAAQETQEVRENQIDQNYSEQSTDGSVADDEEVTSHELDMEMQFQLAENIKRHRMLLRTSRDLNALLAEWFTALFGGYTIMYVMFIYITLNESVTNIFIAGAVAYMLSTVYLAYAYLANVTTDQAAEVCQALYECDWLTSSASFKKKMLIAMTAANQTVKIKPLGLEELSLKMFGKASNSAFKMVTTLKSVF